MSIWNIVTSEAGLAIIISIIGSLWTFFQSRDWYTQAKGRRFTKALTALEAGIDLTYRSYVRAIKSAREDGKLTDEEIRNARLQARRSALQYGRTTGIDVIRELGEEYIELWITRFVRRSKPRA